MFEQMDDAALVDAIDAGARAESIAAAQRLAAIAELIARHADEPNARERWSCDSWDAIAAQVAAAQNISQPMAAGQMYLAAALRNRVPEVAALLADGTISLRLASTIVWQTALIKDRDALALVDAALAQDARNFGPLSVPKTTEAITKIIDRHDPDAVRRDRAGARGRDFVVAPSDGDNSTVSVWGSLLATDGAAVDRRLDEMARQVCLDDPRTIGQRRADAMGALAEGSLRLSCACPNPECPARSEVDPRAAAVVIHIVADASALEAQPDPHINGETPPVVITPDTTLREALTPAPEPPATWLPPGHILGGGLVPAPMVAQLAAAGATVCTVVSFADALPETGYRPSAQLARFIRCRDMTCRFPGCDAPAEVCDIDHAISYPFGPTHPSALRCLCRKHHLLKTFWDGAAGWRDRQEPDGTIVWTAPTGHTYTTRPGSRLLFPALCQPTGDAPTTPPSEPQSSLRGLMMPTRVRTRRQDRARRIDAERALNAAERARNGEPARESSCVAGRDDDPPF